MTKEGPALSTVIDEVQGAFPSDAALQDALSRLSMAGFDRADFSLPATAVGPDQATPEQAAEDPNTDTDNRQIRNMTTSMAGTIGALAAAGATVATGGAAALAVGTAAAAGLGAGALVHATNTGITNAQHKDRERRAALGQLILAVHVDDDQEQQQAMAIMRDAGATDIAVVRRMDDAISASGWTG